MPEIITFDSEEEWLAARQKAITGSDLPILLGLVSWSSPLKLWAEKTGRIPPDPPRLRLRMGLAAEPEMLRELEDSSGYEVTPFPRNAFVRSEEHPWATASLDAWAAHDRGRIPVECKTIAGGGRRKWEESPRGDGIAEYAYVQHQWGLAVGGWDDGIVAACYDFGNAFDWWNVEADPVLGAGLFEVAAAFRRCVLEDDPPPAIDCLDGTTEALKALHPNGVPDELETDEFAEDLLRRKQIQEQLKILDCEKKEIDHQIKQYMGDAEVLNVPGVGKVLWKNRPKKGYVVEPSNPRVIDVKYNGGK